MKIVHLVLGKANPNRMNGVNRVVNALATTQHNQGLAVEVWGITNSSGTAGYEHSYKLHLISKRRNLLVWLFQFYKRVKALSKDTVFHIHGGFVYHYALAAMVIRLVGLQYVFTSHGSYNRVALQRSSVRKRIYFFLLERFLLKGAKSLHFLGISEYEYLDRIYTAKSKVLVPNGQDLKSLTFSYKPLHNSSVPVFGYCGRIDLYTKGLDLMVKAFSDFLNKREGKGILWVVGNGPDLIELKALVNKHGLEEQVVFWGEKFGEEKLNLLANMDVFLHPSRNEGMPTAVLETCGLGVPAIVSRESNMGTCINDSGAGIGLTENTVQMLSIAMQHAYILWFKKELPNMGARAKRMIETEFSWEFVSNRLLSVYS